MPNKTQKLFKNRLVFKWLIPLMLVVLWIGLTLSYIVHLDTAFSVLSYNESSKSLDTFENKKILKGDSIKGSFIAEDKNLGIVAVRFQTFFRPAFINEDVLLFQIKEKGSKDWYYQNTYRDGLIYDIPYFPFGFPVISNSKGKTYEYRIASLNGDAENSVAIETRNQVVSTKYKYTKEELLHNKKALIYFIRTKIINALKTTDVLFSSFIYLLPLIFYSFLIFSKKIFRKQFGYVWDFIEKVGKKKLFIILFPKLFPEDRVAILFLDIILLSCVILDAFFLQLGNNLIYILIPAMWFSIQKYFGVTSKPSFFIGIIACIISPFFLFYNAVAIAEQIIAYGLLFLSIGFIQITLLENKKNISN